MTQYFEKIINIKTGEEVMRPLNEDEIAVIDKAVLDANEIEKEKAKQQVANAKAKVAILNKLGITEEEANLLIS